MKFNSDLGLLFDIFICFFKQYEWLVGSQYKPMELVKSDWATIRKSPPWAIDSWGLGKYSTISFVGVVGVFIIS